MENASKALLISAGILIAILILGIGIYLFATYREIGQANNQTIEINQITKFNNNFTKFQGRKDITAQEIITLYNFVTDYNNLIGRDVVTITATPNITNKIDFLKENSNNSEGKIVYFSCENIETEEIEGKVDKITFERIN